MHPERAMRATYFGGPTGVGAGMPKGGVAGSADWSAALAASRAAAALECGSFSACVWS